MTKSMKEINEFMAHLDALHSELVIPDTPITVYDDLPGVHIFTIYDGGKIKYRLALDLDDNTVLTFKYTKNGTLIPDIVRTGPTFDMPQFRDLLP